MNTAFLLGATLAVALVGIVAAPVASAQFTEIKVCAINCSTIVDIDGGPLGALGDACAGFCPEDP